MVRLHIFDAFGGDRDSLKMTHGEPANNGQLEIEFLEPLLQKPSHQMKYSQKDPTNIEMVLEQFSNQWPSKNI